MVSLMTRLFVLLLVAQSCLALHAADPVIDHCYVTLIDDIEVAAQEAGLLIPMRDEQGHVITTEDGQPIRRGQRIAQVDAQQPIVERQAAEAELKAAQARSEDDIEVRYAEAAYRVAQAEYAAAEVANQRVKDTVPLSEIRRLQLTQHRAYLQIDRSRMEQTVAKLNADVAQASVDAANSAIERRAINSPIDGVVLSILKKPGEWVQIGEPVARVARMNQLRVEGFLSANEYNPSEISNRPVTVSIELARGHKVSLPGRVTYVNPLVQAGNRYRVRAEVQNALDGKEWVLRPGMEAKMTIEMGRP